MLPAAPIATICLRGGQPPHSPPDGNVHAPADHLQHRPPLPWISSVLDGRPTAPRPRHGVGKTWTYGLFLARSGVRHRRTSDAQSSWHKRDTHREACVLEDIWEVRRALRAWPLMAWPSPSDPRDLGRPVAVSDEPERYVEGSLRSGPCPTSCRGARPTSSPRRRRTGRGSGPAGGGRGNASTVRGRPGRPPHRPSPTSVRNSATLGHDPLDGLVYVLLCLLQLASGLALAIRPASAHRAALRHDGLTAPEAAGRLHA